MNDEELGQAIGRLRRAQPLNKDTMAVCEALEKRIIAENVAQRTDHPAPAKRAKGYRMNSRRNIAKT